MAIACSEEVSHLFVTPGIEALREAFRAGTRVRILVRSHGNASVPPEAEADVIVTWDAGITAPEDCVVIAAEAVGALCSPGYAALHAEALSGPVAGWGGLTLLCTTGAVENRVSWDAWFAAAVRPASGPRYEAHDSYTHTHTRWTPPSPATDCCSADGIWSGNRWKAGSWWHCPAASSRPEGAFMLRSRRGAGTGRWREDAWPCSPKRRSAAPRAPAAILAQRGRSRRPRSTFSLLVSAEDLLHLCT